MLIKFRIFLKKKKNDKNLSELYHLKSIEIISKYIKGDCPYIKHLINSYKKHYNCNLEIIVN